MPVNNKRFLLLACLVLVAAQARAQVNFGWSDPSMYSSHLLTDLALENLVDSHQDEMASSSRRRNTPARSRQDTPTPRAQHRHSTAPAPASAPNLSFRPSRAVSERVVAGVMRGIPNTPEMAEARAALQSFQHQTMFREVIQGSGLSDTNMADVLAVYLAGAWMVVHDRHVEASEVLRPARAISRDMTRMLASNSRFSRFTEAQRQEVSESMILHLLAMDGRHSLYQQTGGAPLEDGSTLADLQASVRNMVKLWGLDLANLDLTDQGFVSIRR